MDQQQLIERIKKCKTQREAIKIAAALVLLHTKGGYRVSTLEKKFGDALLERDGNPHKEKEA